ncbi:small ribosomal subunit protein eS12-like isoform X2 [Nicotiana tomentosiformis]|uniref:small ribosomal subunit protein eS12-like isoform X2 n=1 Tax=Nicotiana tomentosiformis TaxID=4098 RepID=UPI00388CE910
MCLMSTYAFQVRCEAGVGEIRFFVQASREHWFSKVCSSTEFARRESCYQHMQQCLSLSAASVEINFTTFVSLTLVSVSFKVLGLGFNIYQERKIGREDAAVAVAAAETPAPALVEPMDIMTALQLVLRKSRAHGGLARGLHEGAKVIEKHAAQLCVLAEDCDQLDYVKLVKTLCADHNISLITVPNAKTLGEWAGLCKIDSEGKARKVVGCGCVVVKDYGEETEGLHIVQEYVKSH